MGALLFVFLTLLVSFSFPAVAAACCSLRRPLALGSPSLSLTVVSLILPSAVVSGCLCSFAASVVIPSCTAALSATLSASSSRALFQAGTLWDLAPSFAKRSASSLPFLSPSVSLAPFPLRVLPICHFAVCAGIHSNFT